MEIKSLRDLEKVAEQILEAANGLNVEIRVTVPMSKHVGGGWSVLTAYAECSQNRADILLGKGSPTKCAQCGELFGATDIRSKFCSGSCRSKAYRKRVVAKNPRKAGVGVK